MGVGIFYLIPNRATNGQFGSCMTDPKEMGGVYDLEKIVVSVIYIGTHDSEQVKLPEALQREKLTALIKKNIEYNFERVLADDDGNKKPVVVLKSRKRGEGWEEIHDKRNLAILVSVTYAPGSNWTPGVEEYGHITYYVFRKDWDNDAAIIPGVYNSGFLTIFPKKDGLEKALAQFFNQLRPIPYLLYDKCRIER